MKKGHHTYKEINTMGMSQLDLILTVYRGAITFLTRAQSAYRDGRPTDGRTLCDRGRQCIVHLYTTLDMEKGENIAARLAQLYAFMVEQLDLAVAQQSVARLGDIIRNLETIKDGWENLKEQESSRSKAPIPEPASSSGDRDQSHDDPQKTLPHEKRVTISA